MKLTSTSLADASTTPSDPSSRADERVPLDAKFLPDKASYSLNNYILVRSCRRMSSEPS